MRFLHTGDWHLDKTIRGQPRLPEFERVLADIVAIARDERVDAALICGDTFDTFSPPHEAEHLLYETLRALVADGVRVVLIAGNHDRAERMDAMAGILRLVGVHTVGSVPQAGADAVVDVPSRDSGEVAHVLALPWVPERYMLEFETLGSAEETQKNYRQVLEGQIATRCKALPADGVSVFAGHVLIDGVTIGEGSSERKLHIGQAFGIDASCFPDTLQYVALGHVHRPQRMQAGAPLYYAGALVQLDFGEEGQDRSVNVVDISSGKPASVKQVALTGGRRLRTVTTTLDELPSHADRYGDDWLRVMVQLNGPAVSLYERVREFLPNAVDVSPVRTDEPAISTAAAGRRGLAPDELFARYYEERNGEAPPERLRGIFRELYEEAARAPR
jgi:exonuclease SbcD